MITGIQIYSSDMSAGLEGAGPQTAWVTNAIESECSGVHLAGLGEGGGGG